MRKLESAVSLGTIAVAACACGFVLASGRTTKFVGGSVIPFTAHIVEKHFIDMGATKPSRVNNIVFGRRSIGSEATVTSVKSPDELQDGQVVYILDVTSSKEIELESFTKSEMTFYLPRSELTLRLDSSRCPANINESSEHSKMLNYDVVRTRTEGRSDAQEQWVAPYLSCFALKEIYSKNGGAWNDKTVVDVTEGEPPYSMFEIPPDYVERSPSQIAALWSAMFPGSKWMSDNSIKSFDENYYRRSPGP